MTDWLEGHGRFSSRARSTFFGTLICIYILNSTTEHLKVLVMKKHRLYFSAIRFLFKLSGCELRQGRKPACCRAVWLCCSCFWAARGGLQFCFLWVGKKSWWENICIYIGKEGKMNSSEDAEWLLHNGKLMRPGLPFCPVRVRKDWSIWDCRDICPLFSKRQNGKPPPVRILSGKDKANVKLKCFHIRGTIILGTLWLKLVLKLKVKSD